MRQQQQQEGTSINISKQKALLIHSKRPIGNEDFFKEGLIHKANYIGVNDYERDESPVSVISHSATIVSQPSSACTSMEHNLNHLISNPNSIHRKRIANPNHQFPLSQEQLSMGTSAASTSEDDSSAYNLPTLFVTVPSKQEELSQQAQHHVYSRKSILRINTTTKHFCEEEAFTKQTSSKTSNRRRTHSEADHVTDSFNSSDDDHHMISIDFQGLQEDPMVLRENFLKSYGSKLKSEEEKHAVDKLSAKLKQKLNRSTANAQKEAVAVRPIINVSASKVVNHAESNSRAGAALNVGKINEDELILKGLQKSAIKTSNVTAPALVSRQRSINSNKLVVPSKWDDAEKWLCFDNHHVSHHNKVKSSSVISRQTLHSNPSTPSGGGGIIGVNKQLKCKEDHANPSRGGVNVNDKAFECESDQSSASSRGKLSVYKAHECKDNVAHSTGAKHLMLQNTNISPGRGAQYSVDVTSGGNASQSSSKNELMENTMLPYGYLDTSKRKWNESIPQVKSTVCQKSIWDCTSSGEIGNPRYACNCKLAAISMSDGEINQINCEQSHIANSQMSASTGSTPGETKTKDSTRPASNRNWMRSKSDALGTPCNCEEYLSSGGEMMSKANQLNVAAGNCASDGEVRENYASDQHSKSSASYTQRFKQHHILQKLRRKCSPRKGAFAITRSGKSEKMEAVGSSTSAKAGSQIKEFVVQTPTHGRSASMKDACTEVSPSLSRRDMGTQMTPPASSPITPKCTSPARHNTPTRTSPMCDQQRNDIKTSRDSDDGLNSSAHIISRCNNVSALELESCHWAKLELRELPSTSEKNSDLGSVHNDWSPAYGLEEEIVNDNDGDEAQYCAKDEVNSDGGIMKSLGALEARAAAWEEAERVKFNAKYKREETRIKAWETLQKAKAEADLKKLEVKLERLRTKATDKVMGRVAAAEKRAEEMRAAAEAQQAEQMRKMRERACSLRRNALFPGSFAVCFARNYMP